MVKRLSVSLICVCMCACSTSPPKGHWANHTSHARVGLILKPKKACELYVERFSAPTSTRACQYSRTSSIYSIYLVKSDGQCGINADFEFTYNPKQKHIDLLIGNDTIVLTKNDNPL